ncbi:MAG TPA: hypothetical protein VE172_01085, partial [Stackebrandtia sp.]|uniref:hypothetical protein n=1 Tax=Stackebrandtia sp. TaxID=2023065 RepID=UPI002D589BCC
PAAAAEPPPPPSEPQPPEPPRTWTGPNGRFGAITVGIELFVVGALFGFVGWGVWALSHMSSGFVYLLFMYLMVLLVAVGVFALARVIGTLIIVRMMNRTRRSARLSHLAAGALMVYAGIWWLGQVPFIADFMTWISHVF